MMRIVDSEPLNDAESTRVAMESYGWIERWTREKILGMLRDCVFDTTVDSDGDGGDMPDLVVACQYQE